MKHETNYRSGHGRHAQEQIFASFYAFIWVFTYIFLCFLMDRYFFLFLNSFHLP